MFSFKGDLESDKIFSPFLRPYIIRDQNLQNTKSFTILLAWPLGPECLISEVGFACTSSSQRRRGVQAINISKYRAIAKMVMENEKSPLHGSIAETGENFLLQPFLR